MGDEFEFLELKNSGASTLNLGGMKFYRRHHVYVHQRHAASAGAVVLCSRATPPASPRAITGVAVGRRPYTGKLDNGGESLRLAHVLGTPAVSLSYGSRRSVAGAAGWLRLLARAREPQRECRPGQPG